VCPHICKFGRVETNEQEAGGAQHALEIDQEKPKDLDVFLSKVVKHVRDRNRQSKTTKRRTTRKCHRKRNELLKNAGIFLQLSCTDFIVA
jgi:hypothetical protein